MSNSIDDELNRILQEEQKNADREVQLKISGATAIGTAPKKSKTTALALALLLGWLGVDRFYLGYTVSGILKMCTFGGCCIWWIIDAVLIAVNGLRPSNGAGYVEDSRSGSL